VGLVKAVLLLQGNTGTGTNWFRPALADELFEPGRLSNRPATAAPLARAQWPAA